MRVDSSDFDFEDLPVSKKPLIEISDEESSTCTTYEVSTCNLPYDILKHQAVIFPEMNCAGELVMAHL